MHCPGFSHASARLASDETQSPLGSDQKEAAAHDCPICHFHAQGQVITDPDTHVSIDVVRIRPATEAPLACPPAIDRPSIPRAPPVA